VNICDRYPEHLAR